MADKFGNKQAKEGIHRCSCGARYWENDTCHLCGEEFNARDYDENDERLTGPIKLTFAEGRFMNEWTVGQ
jgi:hypothetical protein|tara:strand:+ start:38 stop:247 length:210 start_codon:yes stop_codon:yes gene_type:complete